MFRAHADDRVPAQDGEVDQAWVVAIDEDAVGELARSSEVLAAEAAQGVEVFDFLQSNDICLEGANELACDLLGGLVEDCEIRLVDVPAVLDGDLGFYVRVELEPGEEVLDVEGGDTDGGHRGSSRSASVAFHSAVVK